MAYCQTEQRSLDGGFRQFFGNAFLGDVTGCAVIEVVGALRHLQVKSLAELLEGALADLHPALPSALACELADIGISKRSSGLDPSFVLKRAQDVRDYLEMLDKQFDDLGTAWVAEVDRYVKAHSDEFVSK